MLLGLTVSSRTSALASAFGIVLAAHGAALVRRKEPVTLAWMLTAGFAAAMCLLPLREWAAIGRPNFDLITHTQDWVLPPANTMAHSTSAPRSMDPRDIRSIAISASSRNARNAGSTLTGLK